MAFPNPWTNPDYWQRVKIGGRQIRANLVAVGGNKIEDEWNEQRSTGSSGATYVFRGTKPPGPVKLTFEIAGDAVADLVAEFDDLREIWDLLAPKKGFGGNGTGATQGSPGSAAYGKQYMQASSPTSPAVSTSTSAEDLLTQAQAALAAVQSGASDPAVTATASTPVSVLTPGPKPPTLSIENGYLNYIGINAISRKSWEGPTCTPTNSYQVSIEVVPQREPQKVAVGPAAPKSPDNPGQGSIPLGEIQGPAASAKDANTAFAQTGAE